MVSCIEYTSPRPKFEFTTLVVINTDCIGYCKSNYHTITTTTGVLLYNRKKKIRVCIYYFQLDTQNLLNDLIFS